LPTAGEVLKEFKEALENAIADQELEDEDRR
jgi:hypothetical protein